MENIIDNIDFDINCPNCKKNISVKVKDIGKSVTCPSCSKSVLLEDDGEFARESEKAKKALDNLEKTLKDFKDFKGQLF